MTARAAGQESNFSHDPGVIRIAALAALVSMAAFFYYFKRDEILMLGDTVAHINIARRVFDSLTPGPLQLGTVWLPLPHLLMIPFLIPDSLWQNGAGGSIPSMIAYVFGVLGILRLVRGLLESNSHTQSAAGLGSRIAAFAYGANPNLIYTQTTALTEPLYLAFFLWALVYLAEFINLFCGDGTEPEKERARCSLWRCAACVACAELTRYDGWFLACMVGAIVVVIVARHWEDRALRTQGLKFLLAISLAPALWLGYNAAVYGNALEFANGPYSAKAIQQRVKAPYPGDHDPVVSALYFLKSGQVTMAVGNWGRFWLAGALFATVIALRMRQRSMTVILLLLWSPLAFYALSIAYGSVPLHVPMWWPFAVFNQRFGLELLPLFSVSAGLLVAAGWASANKQAWKAAPVMAALILIIASYAFVWRAQPLCWQEASRNWGIRRGLDTAVEHVLLDFPPDARFLMDLGEHVGVMERLGIPLRRTVNHENHRPWKRPADPEGLWERALADPGGHVDYVIVFDGDLVDQHVNRSNLTLLTVIHALDSPTARIYAPRRTVNQPR